MKILMASHYFASHSGGVEIVADRLFHEFAIKGIETVWIAGNTTAAPNPVDSSRAVSLKVFNIVEDRTGLPIPIPTFNALRNILHEVSRADAVILHDCLYLTNIAAFLLAKARKTPTIIIQHIGLIRYDSPVLRLLMRLANSIFTRPMLSRADQVVFIGESTRNCFADLRFKNMPELIYSGVDTDLYQPILSRDAKSAVRAKYGLPDDGPVILFVGRFVAGKGLSILKRMVNERADWTWVFAGRQGPFNPSRWNAANVRVFLGPPDETVAELYRACDLFVLPSKYEAFSLVVREALASGLPVVCTRDVLMSDPAIGPYICSASIFPNDDDRTAHAFLSAIDNLLNSEEISKVKSAERHKFAASRYSWDAAAEQYIKIASRLIREAVVHGAGSAIGATKPEEH